MTSVIRLLGLGLVAVLPGAFRLWRGRAIARLADDPALPERLQANRRPDGVVCGVCIAILIMAGGGHFVWAIPLLLITRMASGYPLRKILYRETWSLPGYLSFFLRLVFAAFGFWILLGITPSLVELAGSYEWIAAAGLALVLVAWSEAHVTVFHVVLRARPVDDPVLLTRFARMRNECNLHTVRLEEIDLRGGVFANAVALSSTRRPMVVVSSTLVERLDHEEVAAILAHELAHIEHANPRRLRRTTRVGYALIAAAVLLSPVTRLTAPEASIAMLVLWPVVLLSVLAQRAQHRQKNETASDLRALALAGNPEALIRALTKLHAVARLPRRWDTEFERHATHPSLARRIQAIHTAAGTAPALLGEAAAFTGADGSSVVTFHGDRLQWDESRSASHTIDYAHVTMLRVEAQRSGAARLVAVDSANRRWEIVLQDGDVARAQATLDIVDTRLAEAAVPPPTPLALQRGLALMTSLAAFTVAQFPVALLGLIAVMLPAPSMTAAAGAAAVGAGALICHGGTGDAQLWMALAVVICGLALLTVSVANRREGAPRPVFVSLAVGLLAAGTLAVWCAIALSGADPVDLHYAVLAWPSAAILPLALAGAFALGRRPWIRYASVPLAAAGIAVMALGSTAFLDRFAHDPFLSPAGAVAMTTLGQARSEFAVPFEVSALRLSSDGAFVALSSENDDDDTTIHAGRIGGPLTDFTADEAVFADRGRLLLLARHRLETVIRVVDLQQENREVWSLRLPLSAVRLLFDAASNKWRILGWDGDGDIVSILGTVADQRVHEERWKSPGNDVDDLDALSISGREMLAIETVRRSGFAGLWMTILQPVFRSESRFWTVSEHGSSAFLTSRVNLTCRGTSAGDEGTRGTICMAFDGARTGFFAVDPASRQSTALASVPGYFYLRSDAGQGWVMGWWDQDLVLLRATTRQGIRVGDADRARANGLAIADKTVGASFWSEHGSTIRLYAIEGPLEPAGSSADAPAGAVRALLKTDKSEAAQARP